jgi:radical SAM superfamily enzyme YgiQ (UPF0313 family)
MVRIILTADKTLMSDYGNNIFLGFAACAPKFIPDWLYTRIFCPPVEEKNEVVKYGHCGQRKIESALLNDGYSKNDIKVIRPEKLEKVVDDETRILCITTHDPLGLGPASSTFSDLGGRESFTSYYFRKLVTKPLIRKKNLIVIVGGSGAWQLTDERITAKLGINCVVIGEGEITAVKMVNKALNGEKLPLFIEGKVVPIEQIPLIQNPTLNGLIEICRGCGRGCKFCNPTMLNYRCHSKEYIFKEAKLNVEAGEGIIFHAEDVLRYKSSNFIPNEEAIIELFSEAKKMTDDVGLSHFAFASVMAKKNLIPRISEILEAGTNKHSFISGQVGIETGSSALVEKYMRGKCKPFKPEGWSDIVIESHKLMYDHNWVPVDTIIMGLPGEKPNDTEKTINLVNELAEYKSLIIPLYFVPIGHLHDKGFFKTKDNTSEQWKLLAICIRHALKWSYRIVDENPSINMKTWKIWAIKRIINQIGKKTEPYLKLMEEGISPLEQSIR